MPTPDDVVEECAGAIYAELAKGGYVGPYDGELDSYTAINGGFNLRDIVRAVFAKLESLGLCVVPRIPTGAMIAASWQEGACWDDHAMGFVADEWRRMIEAWEKESRAMIDSVSGAK